MNHEDEFCYDGVDMDRPINQWQKAIETRDAGEVERLLKEHPEFANTKIMDRYRDGRLNTEDHHQEALDHVARTGHLEIARLLVEAGANEARIRGAFMLAAPNVAEYLLEHCSDPQPNVDLMAYVGGWESLEFWIKRGRKPDRYALHNACCGRPSMRHFAKRDDSKGEWKERFRNTVRVLLESGADPNERHRSGGVKWDGAKPWRNNGETPLHHAAASHDVVLIQQLLDAGADKTLKNDLGDTPGCWAIRYLAPPEVVELLDFEGNSRRDPELWWAAHSGDLEKVMEMIEAGADPNAYEENGSGTLLNFHPEVTNYLLSKGANPDLQRNENIIPVLVGLAGFNTECVKRMLDAGADPNIVGHHNAETALHHSVCGNRFEEVKALLEAGADPNKRTFEGRKSYIGSSDGLCHAETCLHRAAAYGTEQVIDLLLEHGADPHREDADGKTPIDWALQHGNRGTHHRLIHYVENSIELAPKQTAFWDAVNSGDVENVEALLKSDSTLASMRFPTHNRLFYLTDGFPLHAATRGRYWELAKLLLDHGADPDAKRDVEEIGEHRELGMPLQYAVENGNYEFANHLLDRGASPSGHPYCAMATIEFMFYAAQEADVPDSVVRRAFAKFLPDRESLESRSIAELIGAEAPESVKLFARMADLGGQPPFSALVRGGFDDLAIEVISHAHDQQGTMHDYPNSTVFNNVFGAARWFGYPKLVRRIMDHPIFSYSYESAIETIGVAIGSHNRDGDYSQYRQIIVMQLEALKTNGDLEKAQDDPGFNPLFHMATDFTWHGNYGYRAEIAPPECYVDLADLFVEWGFNEIEYRSDKGHSALSAAVDRGSHPGVAVYVRWLVENGADIRKLDPDEVNPISIAKEKGLDEIREILESFSS